MPPHIPGTLLIGVCVRARRHRHTQVNRLCVLLTEEPRGASSRRKVFFVFFSRMEAWKLMLVNVCANVGGCEDAGVGGGALQHCQRPPEPLTSVFNANPATRERERNKLCIVQDPKNRCPFVALEKILPVSQFLKAT